MKKISQLIYVVVFVGCCFSGSLYGDEDTMEKTEQIESTSIVNDLIIALDCDKIILSSKSTSKNGIENDIQVFKDILQKYRKELKKSGNVLDNKRMVAIAPRFNAGVHLSKVRSFSLHIYYLEQQVKNGYIEVNFDGNKYRCTLQEEDIKQLVSGLGQDGKWYLDKSLIVPEYFDCCPNKDNEKKQFSHPGIDNNFSVKSKEKLTFDVIKEFSLVMQQMDGEKQEELGSSAEVIKKIVTQNHHKWQMINPYAEHEAISPLELYMLFIRSQDDGSYFEINVWKKKKMGSNSSELNGFFKIYYSSIEQYILVLSKEDCRFLLENCHSGSFAGKKLLSNKTMLSEVVSGADGR